MATQTLEGKIRDASGDVIEIVVVEITPLPDVVTHSNEVIEETVQTTPEALCRTKTTPLEWTQKMQNEKYTYYQAVEESSTVGWWIIGVGVVLVAAVVVAVTAPVSLPVIGALGTSAAVATAAAGTATAASISVFGGITLGLGFTAIGVGATVEFSEAGADGYTRGSIVRTEGPTDVPVGAPTVTRGNPTYSSLHDCGE